jgi:secreted PhoX family phosphatase
VKRRAFLQHGAVAAAAGALPFLFGRRSFATQRAPLVPDPMGILDLPEGFSYRILEREGDLMTDGYRMPGLPDAMGCFSRADGKLVLMRNHELVSGRGPYATSEEAPPEAYDRDAHGGVTRLVLDAKTLNRESSNLVLAGTTRNCSGGVSPWGWLTCEEYFTPTHGYTFLCSPDAECVAPFQKLPSYGHFYHEGAVVDPRTNIGYFTEDRYDGCLFRFLPDKKDQPFVGRFQALGIAGKHGFSTSTGMKLREPLEVSWVDLPDPDPLDDVLRSTAVLAGAAVVCRGEGIWYADGVVYFTATSGGLRNAGQVFALRPTKSGGSLELIAESTNPEELDGPDAVALAPWGDVLISEDSVTGRPVNHLRGLTADGRMYELARTQWSELAGLCFTPDGRGLFLNIFESGITLVVTGPFSTLRPDAGAVGAGGAGNSAGGNAGGATNMGGSPPDDEAGGSAQGGAPFGEGGGGAGDTADAGARAEAAEFVVSLPAASCSVSPAPGAPMASGSAVALGLGAAALVRRVLRKDADDSEGS